ncbi:helicase SNF2 [Modestobacter sp. I12A-02628]|uniref:DEAD/DEAH box helicase n=1 Tax=Goekera deserti TaxID=2497753 RepID=A0A7K3WFQ7_9ACTN|nr:DEAD/DEAH box helicase [Goekera deserti]MPR00393.1 helicase SNF2 [Goekera deserti]NDI50403.1 helicase SNF2 [Goekera deserti]NEL55331.1 DEAD/DEAH box helicase [Goekera deserti]
MLTEWRDQLSDSAIRRAVGYDALRRGQAYAEQGRVSQLEAQHGGRRLTATVQGASPRPYRTTVTAGGSGWSGACSCPIRVDCKHVAAVLVAVRASLEAPADAPPAGPPLAPWERSLGELVQAVETRTDRAGSPVALQFELMPLEPGRGRGSVGAPGTQQRLIKIRPVVTGRNGGWIRTGISWRQLQYDTTEGGWKETHVGALRALYAAHQSSRNQHYSYANSDVYLHEFGPVVWRMLAQAVADGVPLVTAGKPGGRVLLTEGTAEVAVDVRRAPAGERTSLEPVVRLDGRALVGGSISFLGVPPHGIAVEGDDYARAGRAEGLDAPAGEEPGLVLARLSRPVPPALAGMVARGGTIPIPAEDVDRFLTQWYPGLRQVVPVLSGDGSVELPEIAPPVLVLDVRYAGDTTAMLSWSVRYGQGGVRGQGGGQGASREFPLLDPGQDAPVGSGRDLAAERELMAGLPASAVALGELWLDPPGQLATRVQLRGMEAVEFTTTVLPDLQAAQQVVVEVTGTPPDYRQTTSAPQISFAATDSPDSDWFDLGVTVTMDGQHVPFSTLFHALVRGKTHLVLISGTYFSLLRPEFQKLRALIDEARELQDVPGDGVQLSRFQAGLWEELLALGVVDEQSERWVREVRGLLDADAGTGEGPELPAGLVADLRPYQREGYAWLSFLWDHALGGVLADDMGLGKTLQTLALLCRAHEAGQLGDPVLVVAPTSVVSNWAREAARFAPGLRVVTVEETERRSGASLRRQVAGAHVVLTSYALFRIDADSYGDVRWSGLVLDEAQFVKNHQARTYQCARRLSAPFKLAITGTPLENSLMDLWSLLSIVAPGLFPDPKAFTDSYRTPIERDGDAERLATLRRRIRPLMRRRTKEMVAAELPPKQEQVLEVALNPEHEKLYQTHLQRERTKVLGLVDDMQKNRFTIFRSLTLLRQLSLDPALVDEEYAHVRSSKADAFLEHLTEVVAEGHRALVFSQFTGFLSTIRRRLEEEGLPYVYLDGRTRDRGERIEEFRTGTAPVFLISLKAGGFGLNLTEADYVFVLDPWWNPAAEAQAVDRAHRIGQDKTVMVYRLVATGTIEEKVMALKARKQDLFTRVMDDDALMSGPLTADDVRGLFD